MTEVTKLVVELDFHTPKFTFEGEWSTRDVLSVQRHLTRAWRRNTQSIRREQQAIEPKEVTNV